MRTSSIKQVTFFLSILMLGLLAACSGGDSGSGKKSDDAISMMHYFVEEQNEPAPMAQLKKLEDFREDNPDVEIDEEILSHDDYETKVKTLAAGDELPDLFLVQGSMIEPLADNGQIIKMDDFFDENEGLEDKFVDGMLKPYRYDDALYGITLSGGGMTHLIYYNKDLFEEAGIDEFPETWDEFTDAIDKLKDSGVVPIALGNKEKWVLNSSYLSTLANRFTGSDWFEDIGNHENDASFTDPEFVDALTAINDLAEDDAFNGDMNSIDTNEQQAMYMNEQAAMFIEGDWAIGSLNKNAPEDVLDSTELAFFPAIEGNDHEQDTISGGGGWAYAINANTSDEKQEKIKDLISYLVGEEASELTLANGAIPAIPVEDDDIEVDRLTSDAMDLMEDYQYVSIYDNVLSPSLIEIMNSNLQNMLIGQVTPEEAAKNIQSEYEKEDK